MKYLRKNGKYYMFCISIFLAFNLYFIFLIPGANLDYLYYIDFLTGICFAIFIGVDYGYYRKREKEKKQLLNYDSVVYPELRNLQDKEVIEHDVRVLQQQIQEQFQENCELQDYIAKWCHEIKIPLTASMLMNEKMKEAEHRSNMKEQLERMNQNLNSLLLGCKLQSSLFDLQIKRISLKDCIKASIKNNQFFLIQKHFEMQIEVEECTVYSDSSWVVYILDQFLSNAIKYAKDTPKLRIWTVQKEQETELFVWDNGEGIRKSDIRRIFEKGYTGSNHHNGKYKSTGMGLYMVSKILQKLEHEICVESEYGVYTQFRIIFKKDNFNLT